MEKCGGRAKKKTKRNWRVALQCIDEEDKEWLEVVAEEIRTWANANAENKYRQ